jgi:hypothetical protein
VLNLFRTITLLLINMRCISATSSTKIAHNYSLPPQDTNDYQNQASETSDKNCGHHFSVPGAGA